MMMIPKCACTHKGRPLTQGYPEDVTAHPKGKGSLKDIQEKYSLTKGEEGPQS